MIGILAAVLLPAALGARPPGAFPVAAELGAETLAVVLEVAPGLKVNANPPTFAYLIPTEVVVEETEGVEVGAFRYPPGKRLAVGGLEEPIAVYEGRVHLEAPVRRMREAARLRGRVRYQACDTYACYMPTEVPFEVAARFAAAPEPALAPTSVALAVAVETAAVDLETAAAEAAPALRSFERTGPTEARKPSALEAGGAWRFVLAFLAGLALNLTPCVYPIIPITIGYFARQAGSRPRLLLLAGLFVLSMALVYAALGTAAAMTGALFGAVLQQRAALAALALFCLVMAAGMWGAFEIRLPGSSRLAESRPGPAGAAAMGATMGLVAAPCIGPFIAALLAYVGARGDPAEGFALFLALGLGLGAPYVGLAFASGSVAAWPRAGPVLVAVKRLLGVALALLAVYFVAPILPRGVEAYLWAVLLLLGGAAVAIQAVEGEGRGARTFRRAAGIGLVALGLLAGRWVVAPGARAIPWRPYTAAARAEAAAAGRPVVIDFTAEWCLPCRELEVFTFGDARVVEAFDRLGVLALKADVTIQPPAGEAGEAVAEFGVVGVPTIVFIGPDGRERRDLRLEGFEGPARFVERLEESLSPGV